MRIELTLIPDGRIVEPMSVLRGRLPDLWPLGDGWVYRSIEFTASLRPRPGSIALVATGRLDGGFWRFVCVARDAVGAEVREAAGGRSIDPDALAPAMAGLLPGLFLAARLRRPR